MAYWWVSQNKTFKEEFDGGYLWAPKANKNGRTFHHWDSMSKVRAGDIIFSYVAQHIKAISTAEGPAYSSNRPSEFQPSDWETEGWKISAKYKLLDKSLRVATIWQNLRALLPTKYSPLNAAPTAAIVPS